MPQKGVFCPKGKRKLQSLDTVNSICTTLFDMQTIKIKQNGDVYSCDLDISKDEWLEILKSKEMSDSCKETLPIGANSLSDVGRNSYLFTLTEALSMSGILAPNPMASSILQRLSLLRMPSISIGLMALSLISAWKTFNILIHKCRYYETYTL